MRVDPSDVCGVRWVHVFEEDTDAGAVYRPETDDIPLSRRPRERFELETGGAARVFVGGADDRPTARAATWRATANEIVIELTAARGDEPTTWRVVEGSKTRVVVVTERDRTRPR